MHVDHTHPKTMKSNSKHFKCSQCTCVFSTRAALTKHNTVNHTKIVQQETSLAMTKNSEETDPQILADSVLKQLKELQNDIQTSTSPHITNEMITIERNFVKEVFIKDNLFPGKQYKLIKTQTIKRTNGVTYLICGFCSKEFSKSYNYLRYIIYTITLSNKYNNKCYITFD